MPKNIKGGKNHKKGKNSNEDENKKFDPAPLIEDDEFLDYAVVTKKLGYGQVYAQLNTNGREVLAHIRGTFKSRKFRRTRLRFNIGSIIMISHRDYDTKYKSGYYDQNPVDEGGKHEQVDIVHLYSEPQKRELIKKKEIKSFMYVTQEENGENSGDEGGFEFDCGAAGGGGGAEGEIDIDDI